MVVSALQKRVQIKIVTNAFIKYDAIICQSPLKNELCNLSSYVLTKLCGIKNRITVETHIKENKSHG
jgi:hypothetical protein